MTESTQLQTAENNNAGVVKMEPPPLATSTHSSHTLTHTHTHSLAATAAGGAGTALSPATPPLPLPPLGGHSSQQQQQQQHYALKWNDFQTSILSSFRHLRDEEDFVDVTLACDERSFTAHKVVLSACSPYFRKLLKANPCEHPIVILRDVRSDDVENLLSFMYNGEVNVSHEQLPDFLKTAHLLQIRGLADVNGGYPYSKALSAALSHSSSSSNNNNNNNNTADSSNHNKVSNYLPTALSNAGSNNNSSNGNNNNNSNNNNSSNNSNTHSQISPFNTPQTPSSLPVSSAAAAAAASLTAAVAAAAAATASSLPLGGNSQGQSQSGGGSGSGSSVTPAIQELKASAASPVRNSNPNPNPNPSKASSNHWDLSDMEGSRKSHLTPPPQKRIKSADLFRAQHGISPERLLIDRDFPVAGQHPLTRNRSRDTSKDRDRSLELRESLLGQALENSNGQQANQKHDLGQSAGEDSNSSDTEPSDRGDGQHDGTLDGMDNQRSHSFPNAFLGLQGIPGLLPGPSGLGGNDFGTFLSNQQTAIKQEILDVPSEEQPHEAHAADRQPATCKLAKLMQRPQLAQLFERRSNNNNSISNNNNNNNSSHTNNNNNNTNNNNNKNNNNSNSNCRSGYKKNRSTNSSPTPSARSWNDSEDEHEFNQDDRSSSASSAISLTMKRSRQASESTLYHTLQQHQQQQQQQQLQQQQQQTEHRTRQESQAQLNQQQQQQQQQQYLDELQQSVSVSHQQQLTANLFMARTIALSRSRDFPELFQNTSAAAVAAAAAAAVTANASVTASAIAGGGVGVGVGVGGNGNQASGVACPGGSSGSNSGSNYMLPCPLCETPLEQRVFRQHLDRHYPRDSPVCPVIECGRRFAHPNSVRNHMRIKHTLQWAKMKAMRSSGGPFAGGPDFKFKSEATN
ncbi:protein abrupt isoform X3 [Drosophila albomicans]|uniref:Protein abrupt isoform X3 n=1 Tax=Drosophila albomicans TaxID=7291 RepID=A0A6P8W3E9_DROAB|nr:protein abrupt isoform X3 [Drosophila albomicans]